MCMFVKTNYSLLFEETHIILVKEIRYTLKYYLELTIFCKTGTKDFLPSLSLYYFAKNAYFFACIRQRDYKCQIRALNSSSKA